LQIDLEKTQGKRVEDSINPGVKLFLVKVKKKHCGGEKLPILN
jgi:hypothetical protein